MTFTHALSTNNYGTAKFIVDASAANGTHTTIASALTSASSGDTIFIRPGTYTENLTLKAGVNLAAYEADSLTPNVTIAGTCTFTAAGTVSISGIRLQTNAAALLAVTGSAASIVNLSGCYLNMTDNTGITFSSSNASAYLNIYNTSGNITAAGIAIFTHTSAGTLNFNNCPFSNSGGSSTASTASAGILGANFTFFSNPITTSGTNFCAFGWCNFDSSLAIPLTVGGNTLNNIYNTTFYSGAFAAISVSTSLELENCVLSSGATNVITGAGTINYANLAFITGSGISTTTQTVKKTGPSTSIGSTNSGNTNTLTVTNGSNTASSAANVLVSVAGGTAADAFTTYTVSGVTSWSQGVDNSVSDNYVLSASTALGTTNVLSATTAGAVSFVLGNTDTTRSASGATVSNTISNTSNTASSNALQQVTVAGTSAGDAFTTYTVSGTTNWSVGTDNSVTGDPFVIAASTALGTTNIMSSLTTGEINYPLQPAFLAYLNTSVLNVTGDNTVYTAIYDTEVYDQNGDFNLGTSTFTAPVTGKYRIEVYLTIGGGTSITGAIGRINSSNNTYRFALPLNAADTTAAAQQAAVLADMDAADTFTISVNAVDSGGKIDDFMGLSGGFLRNWVSASLTC